MWEDEEITSMSYKKKMEMIYSFQRAKIWDKPGVPLIIPA